MTSGWLLGEDYSTQRLVIYLLACSIVGYGFFAPELLLLDDDISGRYRALINRTAIAEQLQDLRQWTMGRPVGHISNVSFQGIFLYLPEPFIITAALLAVGAQSLVFHNILLKTGFGPFESQAMALFFFVTPVATSLYLPVHSLATELSTWALLGSVVLLLGGRPLLAGIFASLQFVVYESYATVFWLPVAFVFMRYLFAGNVDWPAMARTTSAFLLSFSLFVVLFVAIRLHMPGVGREAGISELGAMQIVSRMFEAGWIGFKTSLSFQFGSIKWALRQGPKYITALLVLLPFVVYWIMSTRAPASRTRHTPTPALALAIIGIGLVLIFASYLIYFEQRFPPQIKVSRLANIHSAARFGLALVFGGFLLLFYYLKSIQRVVASAAIGFSIAFQHAYGFQETISSGKKKVLLDAMEFACVRANKKDVLVIMTPRILSSFKTDIVLAWTTPYMAPTSFKAWENRVVVIPHNHWNEFEAQLDQSDGDARFEHIKPFIHPYFYEFDWVYPWGDVNRWDEDSSDIVVSRINYLGDDVYSHQLVKGVDVTDASTCIRR